MTPVQNRRLTVAVKGYAARGLEPSPDAKNLLGPLAKWQPPPQVREFEVEGVMQQVLALVSLRDFLRLSA